MPLSARRRHAALAPRLERTVRRAVAGGALALLTTGARADGQTAGLPRPHLDWRTVETPHFIVHYPRDTEAWTADVAARLEGVHASVSALVGSAPAARITVLVEDPFNLSNGSAWPMLEGPAIYLWPVAPEPQSAVGNSRGWGEILAVHEYAHLAQLTWPSRSPRERLLWRFMPVRVGPTARRSPRWVIEGYATYVEGKLTGSGRPHGVARAAALRQFALEGRLPTYAQLNAWNTYLGGSMAYLAGSAYLEWLVERKGEESLVHLWRRLSARRKRGFAEAFAGVYGGMPDELYGRFVAELTAKAMAAEAVLRDAGLAPADTVQRLQWGTGEPALSPDGTRMAVVLRYRARPSRLVVWPTDTQPESAAARRARERMLARDPLDVPAIARGPRPRRALATLRPILGRAHDSPRFMPDGERLLVTRFEPLGDGAARSDLFLWDPRRGAPRRITRGAGVRNPDPHPDGRSAAAVRCLHGRCDLVRVDLASGQLTVLAAGTPTRTFHRPRHSPDGLTVAVGVQDGGLWRVALVDARGGAPRLIGPDDGASRYAPSYLAPDTLVVVSERGGIQNLEAVAPATGAVRPLTRVTGAALAPEPGRSARAVYYLSLHGKGLDLARIHLDSVPPLLSAVVTLDTALAPAAAIPRRPEVDTFPRIALAPSRAYGAGPRHYRLLPGGAGGSEGALATLALASTDMVGRFTWLAQGSWGTSGTWRGGAIGAEWRGTRPSISGAAFRARHAPSEQWSAPLPTTALDITYSGAMAATELTQDHGAVGVGLRAGGSAGRLALEAGGTATRAVGFAAATAWARQRRDSWWGSQTLTIHGAVGRTGRDWRRGTATLTLGAGRASLGLEAHGTLGRLSANAPAFERFVVGGIPAPMLDRALLTQRIDVAGLPFGIAVGERVAAYRLALPSGLLRPFFADHRTGPRLDVRHRVAGVERTFTSDGAPLLGIPGIEAVGGALYSLDEPFRKKIRAYAAIVWKVP